MSEDQHRLRLSPDDVLPGACHPTAELSNTLATRETCVIHGRFPPLKSPREPCLDLLSRHPLPFAEVNLTQVRVCVHVESDGTGHCLGGLQRTT